MMLQDPQRCAGATSFLAQNVKFVAEARKIFLFPRTRSNFLAGGPQLFAEVDKDKALAEGSPSLVIYNALQTFLGGSYVNDFTRFGRQWRLAGRIREAAHRNEDTASSTSATTGARWSRCRRSQRSAPRPRVHRALNPYWSVEIRRPGSVQSPARSRRSRTSRPRRFRPRWATRERAPRNEKVASRPGAVLGPPWCSPFFSSSRLSTRAGRCPSACSSASRRRRLGAYLGLFSRHSTTCSAQIGSSCSGSSAKNAILIVEFAKRATEQGGRSRRRARGREVAPVSIPATSSRPCKPAAVFPVDRQGRGAAARQMLVPRSSWMPAATPSACSSCRPSSSSSSGSAPGKQATPNRTPRSWRRRQARPARRSGEHANTFDLRRPAYGTPGQRCTNLAEAGLGVRARYLTAPRCMRGGFQVHSLWWRQLIAYALFESVKARRPRNCAARSVPSGGQAEKAEEPPGHPAAGLARRSRRAGESDGRTHRSAPLLPLRRDDSVCLRDRSTPSPATSRAGASTATLCPRTTLPNLSINKKQKNGSAGIGAACGEEAAAAAAPRRRSAGRSRRRRPWTSPGLSRLQPLPNIDLGLTLPCRGCAAARGIPRAGRLSPPLAQEDRSSSASRTDGTGPRPPRFQDARRSRDRSPARRGGRARPPSPSAVERSAGRSDFSLAARALASLSGSP